MAVNPSKDVVGFHPDFGKMVLLFPTPYGILELLDRYG
jgi:5,10-methylene-tetrahydrofolate dehydrogenase/methenyl tetrahydrofolate cyclohydrolase